jgi:Uma2 family endonuclease
MTPTTAVPVAPAPFDLSPATPEQPRLSVAEFLARQNGGKPCELVKGVLKEVPMPGTRHGVICAKTTILLGGHVEANDLGRVASHDTFVQTEPDTVRGADVLFWSWKPLPRTQPVPDGLTELPPDLAIEVKSPTDTWVEIFTKVVEYLKAGVRVVVVVDPGKSTVSIYRGDDQEVLRAGDTLSLPDVLPGFSVPVARLFS